MGRLKSSGRTGKGIAHVVRGVVCLIAMFGVLACGGGGSGPTPPNTVPASRTPPLAPNAAGLLSYLNDNLRNHMTIAGIANLTWSQSASPDMVTRVFNSSGKYPALQGFDFLNCVNMSGYHSNADNQTTLAKNWFNVNPCIPGKNGIVTFYWHWRDPSRKSDNFYRYNYQGDAASGVDPSLHIPVDSSGNFDPASAIGLKMKADMDYIASELLVLKNAGVPVLWRPLHEAAGGWFWWGQDGAAKYKALYVYMRKLFDAKGLDNLIWVWNGQDAGWYPGDAFVDIAAWDCYDNNHSNQYSLYSTLSQIMSTNPSKLVALSEVGSMPDPSTFANDTTWWSWFMVWYDSTTSGSAYTSRDFWSGDKWNEASVRVSYLNYANVVTLDKLPKLSPYAGF